MEVQKEMSGYHCAIPSPNVGSENYFVKTHYELQLQFCAIG